MQRLAEFYYASGNAQAKTILEQVGRLGRRRTPRSPPPTVQSPPSSTWTGKPDTWNPTSPGSNSGLHVTVADYGKDVGVAGDVPLTTLTVLRRQVRRHRLRRQGQGLLDAIWRPSTRPAGIATPETRTDYIRFNDTIAGARLYVPSGWSGKMPNGDVIKPGVRS